MSEPEAIKFEQEIDLKVVTQLYAPVAKSIGPARDIDYFLGLVDQALQTHQQRLGIKPDEALFIKAQWPKEVYDRPGKGVHMVTVKLQRRQPWNTSPDKERRPFRPTHRETVDHPDNPNLALVIHSMAMDNLLQFNIQSTDLSDANEQALFFEQFMLAWSFYFRDMGINFIQYKERGPDTIDTIGGMEVYIRPILYLVRTEIISQAVQNKISAINIHYDAGGAIKTTILDRETGLSEDSIWRP
jgi:hypothetical protein